MKSVEYKLLSGDTQSRSIKVVVDANAAFATISWPYEITIEEDDSCSSSVTVANQSETISIAPLECDETKEPITGVVTWNSFDIYYTITQIPYTCPTKCTKRVKNELIADRVWVTPYDVYCNHESKKVKIHYEYYQITECCTNNGEQGSNNKCEIVKKEKKVKEVLIPPSKIECECNESTEEKQGTFEAEEEFVNIGHDIGFKYRCVVNFKCDCEGFSFKEDTCNCDNFSFNDGVCNCNNFSFNDNICDCNNFGFNDSACDCENLIFE